jgi:DNA repair protein RadA
MSVPLEKLRVGPTTLKKLKEAGLTVELIAIMSPKELAERAEISEKQARNVIASARKALGITFMKASEYYKVMSSTPKITTGSKNLDGILGGGIETRTITEFYGEFGSGKTQLCHQLAVNVQLPPKKGGLGKRAIYVDTEGTFRPERIKEMAQGAGLDPSEALDNILYVRPVSSDHQMAVVEEIAELIPKENIGLLIIDSIMSHFRAEYPGRENLAARQQKLNRHLNQLRTLAWIYGVAVVITNQVMARPDIFYGDPTVAVGGHVLYHVPGIRIYLKKAKGNVRIAKVIDAPHLPEAEARFEIKGEGIRDTE